MMQRVSHETVARVLGEGWDAFLCVPEAEKREQEADSNIDSAPESRNNNY